MPDRNQLFVLGAGFTRAFLPEAPLLVDDYDCEELAKKFEPFRTAHRLLELEMKANRGCRISIERLMTRLDGGMPYDSDAARDELRLLLAELKKHFIHRITTARLDKSHRPLFTSFARYCIANDITIVTFNYDDVFDEAL